MFHKNLKGNCFLLLLGYRVVLEEYKYPILKKMALFGQPNLSVGNWMKKGDKVKDGVVNLTP